MIWPARLRSSNRIQLTTDGHGSYVEAVEDAFGDEIDYSRLIKVYREKPGQAKPPERCYSPSKVTSTRLDVRSGNPDREHISTSYVERQNLTMRMSMRRFTRLTNGFPKKIENHMHALSLHYMYYNFGRIHKSLKVTPAMKAGITDHIWSLEEIVGLVKEESQKKRGPYKRRVK